MFSHCVKIVQIRIFFWSVFSCFRTEYRDLRSNSTYSIRIQKNTDDKKLRIWTIFTQCQPSHDTTILPIRSFGKTIIYQQNFMSCYGLCILGREYHQQNL